MQASVLCRLLEGASLPVGAMLRRGMLLEALAEALHPGNEAALLPSVRFGLESALLAAVAEARGAGLPELLGAPDHDSLVPVNGLVGGSGPVAEAVEQAVELVGRGYGCLKIKVCWHSQRPG